VKVRNLAILALSSLPLMGGTIGNPLIARAQVDQCVGCYFFLNSPLGAGNTVTNWSIFSNANSGNLITPFLFDTSTNTVIGIGTTETNTGAGIENFAFGLVSGTAVADAATIFGWHDGSVSTPNSGSIDFDVSGSGVTAGYDSVTPPSSFSVGTTLTRNVVDSGRLYSVQVTDSAVPEPATLSLVALLLPGLFLIRKRKTS
jgi:hypothetical protein